jgi:hypothetical protein
MLLSLLALAAVLIALEETFSRLVRPTWRAVRWFMLPLGALITIHYVPFTLFSYPVIMDAWAGNLFALAAAFLIGIHGTFRDNIWRPQETPRYVPPHVGHRARTVRVNPARDVATLAARAPLKSRP